MSDDRVRFTDVLTTASAVANYRGAAELAASDLVAAIDILSGARTMEDLGRPVSPMIPKPPGFSVAVPIALRELAGRWFARLGGDPMAALDDVALAELREECASLVG